MEQYSHARYSVLEPIEGEVWKPLTINEGTLYAKHEISDHGRIVRYDRKHGTGKPKILKPINNRGFEQSFFTIEGGKRVGKLVHQLVAENFLNKKHDKQDCVLHLNYVKDDNRATNLQWATYEEVVQHRKDNPNPKPHKKREGFVPSTAKLNEAKVRLIKRLIKLYEEKKIKKTLKEIANSFGITYMQLTRIRSGENWGHVKLNDDE